MNRIAASANRNIKEVLRTALIGIQPGDQVMLKGYLRVLLRLEVDLEWVAATKSNVDLFIINSQFQSADSVIKILDSNPDVPVLYVVRGTVETGGIDNNTLTLPLKKLHNFNNWLFENVAVLSNNKAQHHRLLIDDAEMIVDDTTEPSEGVVYSTQLPKVIHNSEPESKLVDIKNTDNNVVAKNNEQANEQSNLLLDFVNKLKLREDKLYELWIKSEFVGILHAKRQCIWLTNSAVDSFFVPDSTWELRDTLRKPTESNKYLDLVHWLWLQAFNNPKALLPLLSATQEYQMRYWMKPPEDESRREVLRIFTAIETQPRTILQLAKIAGTSTEMVSRTIIGLLFSGSLATDIYKALEANVESYEALITSKSPPIDHSAIDNSRSRSVEDILTRRQAGEAPATLSSSVDMSELIQKNSRRESDTNGTKVDVNTLQASKPNQTASQTAPTAAENKKRGFLSRLRDKLGL